MGWSIGFDHNWGRDIGYSVPATCDHPDCDKEIHRGLAYVCGGEPYGGEDGCGLYFCSEHLYLGAKRKKHQVCVRCSKGREPFEPKPDTQEWIRHKLNDPSWGPWRKENPKLVTRMKQSVNRKVR